MKRIFWYLGAILLVALVLGTLLYLRHDDSTVSPGPSVVCEGREFVLAKLKLPPATTVTGRDGKQYAGQPMIEILRACNITEGSFSKLTFSTKDGMTLSIEARELAALYLSGDSTGEWRLIIPSDEFKQRWVRQIDRIDVQ